MDAFQINDVFYKLDLTHYDDSISLLMFMNTMLKKIVKLAEQNPDIMVVWLYGSWAKNDIMLPIVQTRLPKS